MEKTKRAPRGEASIVVRLGRLLLRIPRNILGDEAKEISLCMPDTPEARIVAEKILVSVKIDIYQGNFDPSLERYRRKPATRVPTVYDLWCKYVDYRRETVKPTTLHYYERIIGDRLRSCPQSISKSLEIRSWLLDHMSQAYAARVLTSLSWAVTWAMKHKILTIEDNIYIEMAKQTKPQDQTPPANAFTLEERTLILDSLVSSKNYDHFYPFVYFLFLTGCRPSEAIGLRWGDISKDLKQINFSGSITQIDGKAVRMTRSKNNRVRSLPISVELKDLLEASGYSSGKPSDLVFPSKEDPTIPINYQNFSRGAWERTVDRIVGRKTTPYSCRDTFITEQIGKGVPVAIIARWVDNSPQIIDKRYFDISAVSFTPR